MTFRTMILSAVEALAVSASEQNANDFPPEELRLQWEDSYAPLTGEWAKADAAVSFSGDELDALKQFNQFIWSLPLEPDGMWHIHSLEREPWPQIRSKAHNILELLRSSNRQE